MDEELRDEEMKEMEETEEDETVTVEESETEGQAEEVEAENEAQEEADTDKMEYNEYITYLHRKFCKRYEGNNNLEKLWQKMRAQVNSFLELRIARKHIEPLVTLDYSYEHREVMKFMLFSGVDPEAVMRLPHTLSPTEMIAKYDALRVEKSVTNMLDKPLSTMSSMVESYKADMEAAKKEMEDKLEGLEAKLKDKELELEQTAGELKALRSKVEEDNRKKVMEHDVNVLAEIKAKEMLAKEKEKEKQQTVHSNEIKELYKQIEMLKYAQQQTQQSPPPKKRFGFGKKKQQEEAPKQPQKPVLVDEPLPPDFNLSSYMLSANLNSSQMDVISLAVKCEIPDKEVKAMIDSGKDAIQLKQILEVLLAKRDRELRNEQKTSGQTIQEGEIVYYDK